MKLKDTIEGVSRKLNNVELNGKKTFFKGLGARVSVGVAGSLMACAIAITAFASDTAVDTSSAESSQAKATTTAGEAVQTPDGATTASATMSWWKAGVSEYDLKVTEPETTAKTTKKTTAKFSTTSAAAAAESVVKREKQTKAAAKTTTTSKTRTTTTTTKTKTTTASSKKKAAASKKAVKFDSSNVVKVMYAQDDVRLRKGPGIDYDAVTIVKTNAKVSVCGDKTNGFYPVKTGGNTGWIKASYLGSGKVKTTTTKKPDKEYLGTFKITAYSAYSTAKTASGTTVKQGRTIAAPSRFAFGTKLMFNNHVYTVEDRGSAVVNNVLDLYFDSYSDACQWGVKYFKVYLIND